MLCIIDIYIFVSAVIALISNIDIYPARSELGLDPGSDISSMYHVEQVVKCRVVSSSPASRRIVLSFTTRPMRFVFLGVYLNLDNMLACIFNIIKLIL